MAKKKRLFSLTKKWTFNIRHEDSFMLNRVLRHIINEHSPVDEWCFKIKEQELSKEDALNILVNEFLKHNSIDGHGYGPSAKQRAKEHATFLERKAIEQGTHPDYQDKEPD
ncbi:MAG: hypothetical protein AAGJ37_00475 [Pseudomonadota bacterium]